MESVEEAEKDEQLAAALAAATPEERQDLLCERVLSRAAEILETPDLDEDGNFLDHKLSSLAALRLSKTLTADTGLEVPLVAIVEHPTPMLLGKYLAEAYEAETR